uniref:Uncharacterized protein n=1 Tax=Knipowitschia caucasica TaxID=637954 RepID=A0AAV2JXW0_KNICA
MLSPGHLLPSSPLAPSSPLVPSPLVPSSPVPSSPLVPSHRALRRPSVTHRPSSLLFISSAHVSGQPAWPLPQPPITHKEVIKDTCDTFGFSLGLEQNVRIFLWHYVLQIHSSPKCCRRV